MFSLMKGDQEVVGRNPLSPLQNCMLCGLIACSYEFSLAQSRNITRDFPPVDGIHIKLREARLHDSYSGTFIGEGVVKHVVKPPKQGFVQKVRVICRRNDDAIRIVLLEKLQE